MKKVSVFILFTPLILAACSQSAEIRRKIDVTGIAEQEITPDIINMSISLKEYMNGGKKISIDQLENQLEKAVVDAGIPKTDFTVNDFSSYNYNYLQKKKASIFLASKEYGIRLHDFNRFNQIIGKLDAKGIESTNVDNYDYSKLTEIKRDLKIKALGAAKDKAAYLLNSLGEQLGRVIEIDESVSDPNFNNQSNGYLANTYKSNRVADQEKDLSDIRAQRMKINFQVHAVFEIGK